MSLATRLAGVLANLLLLIFSLLLALLAFEGGLRLFWDGYYVKDQDAYATPSATRSWQNLPDVAPTRGEPEFVFRATHDSLGHRRGAAAASPGSPEKRVFVLGDSFTYGIGVQDHETFCARVEQLDPRLELVNGGVNGYGTAQQLVMLREDGPRLRPDAVLVAFFWNDVGNSYNREHPRFRLFDGVLRDPDPVPVAAPGPGRGDRRKLLRHSYAYRFASDRLKMIRYWWKVALGVAIEESDFVSAADRAEAWELEAALVREIRDEAARLGARTILTAIPDQVRIEPETRVVGLDPADYDVDDHIFAIARELDVAVIDLAPALRAAAQTDSAPLYYRKDRHLTVRGNEVVARALQEALDVLLFSRPGR